MKQIFVKFKKLELRLKLVIITGLLTIVGVFMLMTSSPLFLAISCSLFNVCVFYNLYVTLKQAGMTRESIKKEIEEGKKEYKEGNKFVGVIKISAVSFAFGIGIPGVIMALITVWLTIFNF